MSLIDFYSMGNHSKTSHQSERSCEQKKFGLRKIKKYIFKMLCIDEVTSPPTSMPCSQSTLDVSSVQEALGNTSLYMYIFTR